MWVQAKNGPPKRTFVEAGDAIMRNAMVWHRGVANYSDEHRPMISVGYGARYVRALWLPACLSACQLLDIVTRSSSSSSLHVRRFEDDSRPGGFTAPESTADWWTKHPVMKFYPVLLPEVRRSYLRHTQYLT